jgi:Trypsin
LLSSDASFPNLVSKIHEEFKVAEISIWLSYRSGSVERIELLLRLANTSRLLIVLDTQVWEWIPSNLLLNKLSLRSVTEMSSDGSVILIFFLVAITSASPLPSHQCGEFSTTGGLVFHGTLAKRDRWPFLAALFNTETQKFFCGGSLISVRSILTAAHCIQDKNRAVARKPSEVIAFLGRYDLNVSHERDSVPAYPVDIVIHPDWKPFDLNYDADIAIIKLSEDVSLRRNIYTVCLWTPDTNILREDDGTVVGW